MNYLVTLARIIVGLLFSISGFIKLNDPVGFSFKLEEYFSEPVLNLPFLEPYALAFALFVVILEVILGITLLLGFRLKLTLWTLLVTIVFFTFLTLYSAVTGKVTDCGCFGDALKLTPWQSFYKDVALLVLILVLLWGQRYLKPLGSGRFRLGFTVLSLLACIWFANHVLNHLPWIDFRAYHLGAHIPSDMSIPEDAPKPVIEYDWKFNIGGEERIITTNGDYPQVDGEFIGVEDTREISPGYEPPIHDFTIEADGTDYAASILERKQLLLVISYDLLKSHEPAFEEMARLTDSAKALGYSVIGMSASSEEQVARIRETYGLDIPFYFTDQTTLKTIVRSNPGLLRLEAGTIRQKLHYNDLDELELDPLTEDERYNMPLKAKLDRIHGLDQQYRSQPSAETWPLQQELDNANQLAVDSIMAEYGYPGKSLVGPESSEAAWYVIQHSDRIGEYLPQIKHAAETGEIPYHLYAKMLDRSLVRQGLPQRYGTQGQAFFIGTPRQLAFIWPIEDPEQVNERRQAAGFDTTVEENAKLLFGPDFQYRAYTMEEVEQLRAELN